MFQSCKEDMWLPNIKNRVITQWYVFCYNNVRYRNNADRRLPPFLKVQKKLDEHFYTNISLKISGIKEIC
jgi:hypothetical protein